MCTGLEIVGLAASAAKSVVGFIGAQRQAQAAQAAANAQAERLERQAVETEEKKQEDLKLYSRDAQRAAAQAEAKAVANGLDISGQSSAGRVLADYKQIESEDREQIALEGERRKRRLKEDAATARAEGANARSAGTINAAGSLISGAGTIADRWRRTR